MKTEQKVLRRVRDTSSELTSAEYMLLVVLLIVTCVAASHFMKGLVR